MPEGLTDDKSTLVQVMAWCRQATSHYLSQCWLSSLSPYGVARPQRVKLQSQYHTCWCPGNTRSQGITRHDSDLEHCIAHIGMVSSMKDTPYLALMCGVSFVMIPEKTDHVITASHYIEISHFEKIYKFNSVRQSDTYRWLSARLQWSYCSFARSHLYVSKTYHHGFR